MVARIGLISDTHGRLDPRVAPLFEREGVGAIIHAGDIGGPDILWELNAVAPVTAVLGNNDYAGVPGWALDPVARLTVAMAPGAAEPISGGAHGATSAVVADGSEEGTNLVDIRIAVVHVLGHLRPIPHDVDVVVAGHTHVPSAVVDSRSGALCVNPGSASRPRAGAGPTVGILEMSSAREVLFRTVPLNG